MADKNFKGGPGGRLKAAAANFNKPTTQDSLDLYNSTMAVEDFYKKSKLPYKGQNPGAPYTAEMLKNPFKELDDANILFNKKIKDYPAQDVIKNNIYQTVKGASVAPLYRKEIDKNKFAQRELSHGTLNIDAPMAMYDRRINPTIFTQYIDDTPIINDTVEILKYDPLAVKPVSMLTPKERIEREKKYGKIPSSIPKPQPKPVQVIKRKVYENLEPMTPRQSPVPQLAQPQIVSPVMRPVSVPQTMPMGEPVMEEDVVTERPVSRKPPRAVMPRRAGGWSNQPLLMKIFPKIYEK